MQHIQNDIKQNNFKHAYLLFGDERYLKKQFTTRLREAMCAEGDQMNTHFYSGKDVSVGEIIDLAETLPFLAERRVIFISDSGLFKANNDKQDDKAKDKKTKSPAEKLADYLSSPNETTYFVFTESAVDKRSKLYKTIQSEGYAAEFSTQDETTLKRWIAGTLGKENKKITENTVQLLLQKTGTDMENIQMELEKLICYCMDREVVTSEDVEAICTTRVSNHIFDMINAVAAGRTREALQLYYDLLSLKESPLGILALIARQCNLLLQTKELRAHGYDSKAIAPKIGVPPFVAGKYIAQAGQFKTSVLRNALEQCAEAEADIKNGRMNDKMSVEILILTVLSDRKAN